MRLVPLFLMLSVQRMRLEACFFVKTIKRMHDCFYRLPQIFINIHTRKFITKRRTIMKKNLDSKKCITAAVLLLVAILSITVVGKYASAPENHQKTIASLDEKKQTVMELTAASTVTSALITLLPGDTATPIAEKMADVSGYLLVVLCAIYLEKYLVTITGYVAFTYLIPIACGLWILNLIFANATVRKLAAKHTEIN